jgi:hypothetical protein
VLLGPRAQRAVLLVRRVQRHQLRRRRWVVALLDGWSDGRMSRRRENYTKKKSGVSSMLRYLFSHCSCKHGFKISLMLTISFDNLYFRLK